MEVHFNEVSGCWETEAEIAGLVADIVIADEKGEAAAQALANQALPRIHQHWLAIERNLIDSLHDVYLSEWVTDGDEALEPPEFLESLMLETVVLEKSGAITLYFGDSDLFDGHWIEIFWPSAMSPLGPATLVE